MLRSPRSKKKEASPQKDRKRELSKNKKNEKKDKTEE